MIQSNIESYRYAMNQDYKRFKCIICIKNQISKIKTHSNSNTDAYNKNNKFVSELTPYKALTILSIGGITLTIKHLL